MNERVPKFTGTLTATGGTDGYVTFTANTGCYPGAVGYLSKSDGSLQQKVLVTNLSGATKAGIRFLAEGNDDAALRSGGVKRPILGRSDCSAFASGSLLFLPAQVVGVHQPIFDPLPNANL
jgi:hypothetical protein